jgi:hypothetical protein
VSLASSRHASIPRPCLSRALLFATLALAGCGRSHGVPDEDLGNLVIAPKQGADPIKVDKAAKDPAELGRALLQPYREVVKALGPHAYSIATETLVDEAGKRLSALSDQTTIELGAAGAYHAIYNNSADYGREVTFHGGRMYLRPRYQRWHARAPESPEEPARVRDSFFDAIGATWDLLSPGAELTDGGAVQVAGRAGRKVVVKLAPSPRSPAPEPLTQRKWREKRTVDALAGELVLDVASGMPLAAKLSGTVSFSRDGRRFTMKLSVDGKASAIGQPVEIAPPPEDQIVATPERRREVDDRDYLLQGIAPPSRRNPDGTPVPPSPRFPDGTTNAPPPITAPTAAGGEPPKVDDKTDKSDKSEKRDREKSEDKSEKRDRDKSDSGESKRKRDEGSTDSEKPAPVPAKPESNSSKE